MTGESKNKLYVGVSADQINFSKETSEVCEFESSESLRFMIRLVNNVLFFSRTNPRDSNYEVCAKITLNQPWMESFYLYLIARSAPTTNYRIDIKSMILSSDVENLGISEFEAKYDDNDHKLFRQIHFFKMNEDQTSHFLNNDSDQVDVNSLNITSIALNQVKIVTAFDYCNVLLEKNIESTDDIVTFLDQQKQAIDDYSKNVINNLKTWINETKVQFDMMERDTMNILSEYKSFDIESEFQITQNLLEMLKEKFKVNSKKLENLKTYGSQIKLNLKYIKSKKSILVDLPIQIQNYIKALEESSSITGDSFILLILVVAGFVVLVALVSIFCRLKKGNKGLSLGQI